MASGSEFMCRKKVGTPWIIYRVFTVQKTFFFQLEKSNFKAIKSRAYMFAAHRLLNTQFYSVMAMRSILVRWAAFTTASAQDSTATYSRMTTPATAPAAVRRLKRTCTVIYRRRGTLCESSTAWVRPILFCMASRLAPCQLLTWRPSMTAPVLFSMHLSCPAWELPLTQVAHGVVTLFLRKYFRIKKPFF